MAGRLVLTNTASAPLRARYDATNYADFTVSSTGDLTIAPSGGDASVTGTLAVSSTLAVTGVSTFTGDVVAGTIRRATSDGADNSLLSLSGGGAVSATRGAYAFLYGNEQASSAGVARIGAGNVAGAYIRFDTEDIERGRISGGVLAWGTTVVGTTPAGGVVTKNGVGLYGANAAGTDTSPLISLNGSDQTQINANGRFLALAQIATETTAGAVSKYLRIMNGGIEYKIPMHAAA
jgi:hypothetical protein